MMSTRTLLYAAGLTVCSLLLVAAVGAQQPREAGGVQQPRDAGGAQQPRDGEQIMNASCGSCHEEPVIQTAAKDEAAWKATIERMIQKGATVAEPDKPLLLTYLVRTHGPMPDGPGKDVILNTCTICHDLTRVKRSRHTAEEWEDTLVAMLNEGAPLSDDDFPVVLNYLAKHFGAEPD